MATIKQKPTEAKKSTKKKVMPTFKDKFPVLSQMETWTGPFRRRMLTWDYGTALAMNPYTMGVVSVYASNVHKIIPLITGTGYSMLETFKPVSAGAMALRWRLTLSVSTACSLRFMVGI